MTALIAIAIVAGTVIIAVMAPIAVRYYIRDNDPTYLGRYVDETGAAETMTTKGEWIPDDRIRSAVFEGALEFDRISEDDARILAEKLGGTL